MTGTFRKFAIEIQRRSADSRAPSREKRLRESAVHVIVLKIGQKYRLLHRLSIHIRLVVTKYK